MTAWKPVDVTIPEGSLQCTLRVTILEKTKSEPPEHKVATALACMCHQCVMCIYTQYTSL